MKIYKLEEIKKALEEMKREEIMRAIEEGFIAYSQGKAVIPPVGELIFKDPPGDVHIKYGYIVGGKYYVIKIASGFYENYKYNLPSTQGLMLLFSQKTGVPEAILLDEGYLTDVRTAMAGAIAAKYLAPKDVSCIGVLGAGIQGKMQVLYLDGIVSTKDVVVWSRTEKRLKEYKEYMENLGYNVKTTTNPRDVAECPLIVTATPSTVPLLKAEDIKKGTHITAMGADTPEKNEIDPKIFLKADRVVADSISQCIERGEIHHAVEKGYLSKEKILELGKVIPSRELWRQSEDEITVADLTGVAVQDLQIAKVVYEKLKEKEIK